MSGAVALSRWPALDGLRGLMTVGVFLAHIRYEWFPGSIIFMDTFFMMSSFFISRLLLKGWQGSGRIDFAAFYLRRAKRLYPALLIVVAAVSAYTIWGLGYGWRDLLHVAGTLFYFSNWLRALGIEHLPHLGHTWSLSIEEQYYLLWPIVLAAGLKYWPLPREGVVFERNHVRWCIALGLLVLLAMVWRAWLGMSGASMERLYNGTDMRIDSLALGALLALTYDARWVQRVSQRLASPALLWLVLLFILFGGLTADIRRAEWFIWQQPVYVVASLALVMGLLARPLTGVLKRVLENPVSLYLGAICYGLYLWHYPLIQFVAARTGWTDGVLLAVTAPLTLALAAASYRWVEAPLLVRR